MAKTWVAAMRAGHYPGRPRTEERRYGEDEGDGWWAEFEQRPADLQARRDDVVDGLRALEPRYSGLVFWSWSLRGHLPRGDLRRLLWAPSSTSATWRASRSAGAPWEEARSGD